MTFVQCKLILLHFYQTSTHDHCYILRIVSTWTAQIHTIDKYLKEIRSEMNSIWNYDAVLTPSLFSKFIQSHSFFVFSWAYDNFGIMPFMYGVCCMVKCTSTSWCKHINILMRYCWQDGNITYFQSTFHICRATTKPSRKH